MKRRIKELKVSEIERDKNMCNSRHSEAFAIFIKRLNLKGP